jgi:glycosyltransferase involved in cell wall biosynthesis
LWNPVDEEFFAPSDAPPADDAWRLLAMGTNHAFYRVKASLDTLAVLLRRGIPVSLLIAGEFRWKDGDREVADYIAGNQLGDHVSLHPRFSQAEAPSIYRRAHVLLHPKYNDPCPTVPIEAMACGLPVVGSRSGGMPELVPAEAGRLVDVPQSWTREHTPTAEQMADAVAEIFSNLALHSQGARSHAVKSFSRGAWVDRHEQIFRTVMGGS